MSRQKFLWKIAGADVDILRKCHSDQRRIEMVGAAILVSVIIALVSGSIAAWLFTGTPGKTDGSLFISSCFGLLCAIVILCLQRSLVVTINGGANKAQSVLGLLMMRVCLAAIISFLLVIPFQLIVFEDDNAPNANELDDIIVVEQALDIEIKSIEEEINRIEASKNAPQSKAYLSARNKFEEAGLTIKNETAKIEQLRQLDGKNDVAIRYRQKYIEDAGKQQVIAEKEMTWAKDEWVRDKNHEIEALRKNLNQKIKIRDNTIKSERGVVTKSTSVNRGNLISWLMLMIIFVIELTPTIIKIGLLDGTYDRMKYV